MNTQCMQTRLGSRGDAFYAAGLRQSRAISLFEGLYSSAAAGIDRWTAGFVRAQKRRAALRELSSLSDRQLADIGVERFQIRQVVDGLLDADGRRSHRGAL